MKKILIFGAGGHGQVVADILWQMKQHGEKLQIVGFLDDDVRIQGKSMGGLEVLGPISLYQTLPHEGVILAIGDNCIRRRIVAELALHNETFFSALHPSAIIGQGVTIGPGSMICAGSIIGVGAHIGSHVILNTACSVDHENEIGDFAHMAPGSHAGGQVVVGEGALIGVGACLLPRLRIGAWSIIGGGSVVLRDVPNGVVAYGNPCRVIKKNTVMTNDAMESFC